MKAVGNDVVLELEVTDIKKEVGEGKADECEVSWSGYRVVCSNEDFGVLRVLGVLGDSGFSGKRRLHKLT